MEKQEVQSDIDTFNHLAILADSDGGKIIVAGLKQDVVNGVEVLISKYKTASEIDLRSTIAKLQSDLSLLRVLTRADKNKKMAQAELEKMLAE